MQLKKFIDIPVSTREEARGFRPHPEEPRFLPIARSEGSFPCFFGKEFPGFPSHLKRRPSQQESREELQGRATIPRASRCLSAFQMNQISLHCLDFHAEDQLTPRWQEGQPCGKASWESLQGKPQNHFPRGTKRDIAATARDESRRACTHWGPGLTPLWRLQMYPKIHVSSGEESSGSGLIPHKVLGPDIDWRGIPRGPLETPIWTGLS